MKQLLCLLSLLVAIVIPLSAMAQDDNLIVDGSDESASKPVASSDVHTFEDVNESLKQSSKLLKGFGYSFIGAGAISLGAGAGVYGYYENDYNQMYDENQSNKSSISSDELRAYKKDVDKKRKLERCLWLWVVL